MSTGIPRWPQAPADVDWFSRWRVPRERSGAFNSAMRPSTPPAQLPSRSRPRADSLRGSDGTIVVRLVQGHQPQHLETRKWHDHGDLERSRGSHHRWPRDRAGWAAHRVLDRAGQQNSALRDERRWYRCTCRDRITPTGGVARVGAGRESITTAANVDGTPQLFTVSLDGSTRSLVTDYSTDPAWAPDGEMVVYSGPDIGTTFSMKAANTSGPVSLPNLTLTRGARRVRFLPERRALVVMRGEVSTRTSG